MNDIYFKCRCGKSLAVDLAGAGRAVRCVDCARPVEVPDPGIEFACPLCGELHLGSADIEGDEVTCTGCGEHFIVPASAGTDTHPWLRALTLCRRAALPFAAAAAIALLMADKGRRDVFVVEIRDLAGMPDQAAGPPMIEAFTREVVSHGAAEPESDRQEIVSVQSAAESTDDQIPSQAVARLEESEQLPEEESVAQATPPEGLKERPAEKFADGFRALLKEGRDISPWKHDANFAARVRAFRAEFMEYTRTHSGSDLDSRHWLNTARSLLWLSSFREYESFEAADRLFRENVETIASARTDDPAMNSLIIFESLLLHMQQWVSKAPPEASARLLDEAAAIAAETDDGGVRERWGFSGGAHHIQVMFALSSLTTMNPKELAEFRASRTEKTLVYLNDESIPLNFRTQTVCWWAAYLSGEHDGAGAISVLDGWRRKYGDKIVKADFYELRMLYAFHYEADLAGARELFREAARLVRDGKIEEGAAAWVNMSDKYFKYLLLPEYEVKRRYMQGKKTA